MGAVAEGEGGSRTYIAQCGARREAISLREPMASGRNVAQGFSPACSASSARERRKAISLCEPMASGRKNVVERSVAAVTD